jgi:pimeloyl-ACP methyl ester carboxylesterase
MSKLTLRIDGDIAENAAVTEGWDTQTFELGGAARGEGGTLHAVEIDDDDVLELELSSGAYILVAAADAECYLGSAVGRGAGKPGEIQVGATLRLAGVRPPEGLSRDGLGAWLLKGLRVYRRGPAAMVAVAAAGAFQDAQLDDRNGLYRCATESFALTKVDKLPSANEPTLLFIHGTASSTEGSFKDLWAIEKYREKLVEDYGQRIYAFEHRSLTESPVSNALELVKTLPKGARLHLVSHSRGGMVGELLARANRIEREPFTSDEIERFLKHAERLDRKGFDADAKRLAELNRELIKRAIHVERFVRVACPARGTTLASGRLDRWASVMLNLLGKGFDAAGNVMPGMVPVAKGYHLLKRFLLAVVKERTDARILPGLEAMMPDSPLVGLLNNPDAKLDPPVHVIAGDFEGEGLLPWLGDCVSEVFYGGETDLVVNTPSMTGGAARARGIYRKPVSGPKVTHFSYFERDESALALFGALRGIDSDFDLLAGPSQATISRGGRDIKANKDAPICFLLPGIMGSHIQLGKDRIWFEPFSMISGNMAKLRVDAENVTPDGWMDRNYEMLARHLADSHELRPFAYDWRLSIVDAAERFGKQLDQAMQDAKARGKPLRIVAHSMGGLVARLALKTRWDAFKAIPGSRLLQLGTPNNGSHSIAAVLMARDDFVQTIERWFDWQHDMREFLEIVRDFPGVLELLPWPGENGQAPDGVDYFDAKAWQDWYAKDQDSKKGKAWIPPQADPLKHARAAIDALRQAELDPACTLYVAGHSPTPIAVRVVDGQVEIGWTDEGDGRVPWKTGIPAGVPVWYVDSVHGDLANHTQAYEAYRELIETGDTRDPALSRVPPVSRGDAGPIFRPRGLANNALYPSVEEVLAAATGGARPGRRAPVATEPAAVVEVVHGSLASAVSPVVIGAYANDSLRGSAKYLDGHLGGQLQRAFDMGRYPAQPDDAMVFLNPSANGKPPGAIVVGLGALGELMPGELTSALTNGLLEYACSQESCPRDPDAPAEQLAVSALLVGTGFIGLTVELGARCLVEALDLANGRLRQAEAKARIRHLTLYEEVEDRAIAAVQALRDLATDRRYKDAIRFDGRMRVGAGGYRGRCVASGGDTGAYRVLINDDSGGLRFTVITDRARNEVAAQADQRQAVDGLIASLTRTTVDKPGLSRALFELLVPNAMKGAVADVRSLMLSVDGAAAVYPWEMMRDGDGAPLATRVEMVRQLASTRGRGKVPLVTEPNIFIVGDTQSGMPELLGAQAEAKAVAKAFAVSSYVPRALFSATAEDVYEALFHKRYRFMHFAGHGVVKKKLKDGEFTGMVLGPETFLTSAQVAQLRHVPEFVFINCCHLGSMKEDAQPRWGELAASLATQFIEMGSKAVIAAGWAVDDQASATFAKVFYENMLKGVRFGRAVMAARRETHARHAMTNTWGAYQAYGDERYQFPDTQAGAVKAGEYVHPSHLIADMGMVRARLQGATAADKKGYYSQRVAEFESIARSPEYRDPTVLETLAGTLADLNHMDRAIACYRAALALEDANLSLKGLEQLGNLEVRQGAKLAESTDEKERQAADAYMDAGLARLEQLVRLAATVERLSLLGSHVKRRLQADLARRKRGDIKPWLEGMRDAYWRAAEQGYARNREWDYYPLFNALDSAFLLLARGELADAQSWTGKLAALLQAGAANGRARFAKERVFFHACAELDAARIDALWACYDGRAERCICEAKVLGQLVDQHCALLKRMGSRREQDSMTNQLRFLMAALPSDANAKRVKAALARLAEGIGKCLGG